MNITSPKMYIESRRCAVMLFLVWTTKARPWNSVRISKVFAGLIAGLCMCCLECDKAKYALYGSGVTGVGSPAFHTTWVAQPPPITVGWCPAACSTVGSDSRVQGAGYAMRSAWIRARNHAPPFIAHPQRYDLLPLDKYLSTISYSARFMGEFRNFTGGKYSKKSHGNLNKCRKKLRICSSSIHWLYKQWRI